MMFGNIHQVPYGYYRQSMADGLSAEEVNEQKQGHPVLLVTIYVLLLGVCVLGFLL
jgi:hypothetical protein